MVKGWEIVGTGMGSYKPYANNVDEDNDDALVFMDEDSDIEDGTEFGADAIDVLRKCDGISVILLDVVMETPDAGLKLAHYIRETLGQDDIRIILRTGQPGLLSEREAKENDQINRYVLKSQITRSMLMDAIASELIEYLGSEA